MSNESLIDVAVSAGVIPVPLHRLAESLLPAHLLRPSQLMKLSGMNSVTQIVELTVGDEGDELILLSLLAQDLDQVLGDLQIRYLVVAANVVNVGNLTLVEDGVERAGNILNEQKVTGVGSISVQGELHTLEKLVGELGNELLGVLVRAVHVVAASDDAGQLERSVVGLDDELGAGLGGGVRIGGLQDVFLSHGLGVEVFTLAVHLVGGHVDETTDSVAVLGRLEQDVGAVDVGLGECEGVTERVVNVSLGGEMHNGVDLLLLEDVVDEVGTLDVALDELEIGQILDVLEIVEAGAVIELVINDDCEKARKRKT